jgi:hypothetical protein
MFTHNMLSQYFPDLQPQQVHDGRFPLPLEATTEQHSSSQAVSSNHRSPSQKGATPHADQTRKAVKQLSYSAVTSGGTPDFEHDPSTNVLSPQRSPPAVPIFQPPPFIPIPIPVVVGEFPPPRPFPPHIVDYLNGCVKDLMQQLHNQGRIPCAVGSTNIDEVYPISQIRRTAHFQSPLHVLSGAMKDIDRYILETQKENPSQTETSNRRMLNLIDRIYNQDVAVCASLLGAFMEQQIRIPLLNSPKETAEELSQAAPVAVGVWALFSQNLRSLQDMLSSSNHSALVVEIKDYIEGISQQLPENENPMYAAKLQFLLQGIEGTVTASSQYISYSLEHQLCRNIKFEKTLSLKRMISQWDEIFKNDALSLISQSHRGLVARWMKWTILVHDLREALAQYTCIGVTGLVNSGKSLLVKELFRIEKVKVGTRAVKRTTVPLLYNLEESIEGLDIIDFPGVDDSDHTIPELANLLLSLAQIVVFVVDYR